MLFFRVCNPSEYICIYTVHKLIRFNLFTIKFARSAVRRGFICIQCEYGRRIRGNLVLNLPLPACVNEAYSEEHPEHAYIYMCKIFSLIQLRY
jgi:hypothetical protein